MPVGCRGPSIPSPGGSGPWGWPPAARRTTDPLLLLLVLGVLGVVVANRRSDAPWARAFKYYLYPGPHRHRHPGGVPFGLRWRHRHRATCTCCSTSPTSPCPSWAAGVQTRRSGHPGGDRRGPLRRPPAGLPAVLPGGGQRAGQSQAGPAGPARGPLRARCGGGGLPQRRTPAGRERAAGPPGPQAPGRDRPAGSTPCAASPSRSWRTPSSAPCGWPRPWTRAATAVPAEPPPVGPTTRPACCMLGGMAGLCLGAYGLLDSSARRARSACPPCSAGRSSAVPAWPCGSRRVGRSQYRPDPWKTPEWIVVACGLVPAVVFVVGRGCGAAALNPSVTPLGWPSPAAGTGPGHPGGRPGRGGRAPTGSRSARHRRIAAAGVDRRPDAAGTGSHRPDPPVEVPA